MMYDLPDELMPWLEEVVRDIIESKDDIHSIIMISSTKENDMALSHYNCASRDFWAAAGMLQETAMRCNLAAENEESEEACDDGGTA